MNYIIWKMTLIWGILNKFIQNHLIVPTNPFINIIWINPSTGTYNQRIPISKYSFWRRQQFSRSFAYILLQPHQPWISVSSNLFSSNFSSLQMWAKRYFPLFSIYWKPLRYHQPSSSNYWFNSMLLFSI